MEPTTAMAVRRYDTKDFAKDLKKDPVNMNPHEADALAEGLGMIAGELRENHETIKGALNQLDEGVGNLAAQVAGLRELTRGSPDPEQHSYVIFPIGGSFLGSCSGCSWQRGGTTESAVHDLFRVHHTEFLDDWTEQEPGKGVH